MENQCGHLKATSTARTSNYFARATTTDFALMDSEGTSEWNFKGCATSGPAPENACREFPAIKDYWFDWRNYHPNTTVYRH